MARLESLRHRLVELERGLGLVKLADGTPFKPGSGLAPMLAHARLNRDLGRAARLSDFSPEEQERLQSYAKWAPDSAEHGQVSILITDLARSLCDEDRSI